MARVREFDETEVLERAMRLFWRRGYEATSIHDLVAEMGIGRGSLYGTFGDKHTLYLAALDRYCATVGSRLLDPLDAPLPLREALRRVFEQLVEESLANNYFGCFMANATLEMAVDDPDTRTRADASRCAMEERLYTALAQAQASGELGAEHDPRSLARYLFNAIHGLRVTAGTGAHRETLTDIVRVTLAALD